MNILGRIRGIPLLIKGFTKIKITCSAYIVPLLAIYIPVIPSKSRKASACLTSGTVVVIKVWPATPGSGCSLWTIVPIRSIKIRTGYRFLDIVHGARTLSCHAGVLQADGLTAGPEVTIGNPHPVGILPWIDSMPVRPQLSPGLAGQVFNLAFCHLDYSI